MNAAEDFAAGMAEAEAEFNHKVTIDGAALSCIASRVRRGRDPLEGGQWVTYSASLEIRRSLLAAIPAEGQKVTFDGQTMFVGMVHASGTLPIVKIELQNTPPPRL